MRAACPSPVEVILNGPEPSIQTDYGWPGLALTNGIPAVFSALHSDADNDSYQLFQLSGPTQ